MDKKTALYEKHLELGGKMVSFAGYSLPVQYKKGIIAEHNAVRERAGLFDVSHMGEFTLTGNGALHSLNRLLTNDFTGMESNRVRYSPMCNESGGTVDDLVVYKTGEGDYMLVVNAANRAKDFEWMREGMGDDTNFKDISDHISQLALQGPFSGDILAKIAHTESIPAKYYTFVRHAKVADIPCVVSRTGYTGEAGFELYCENRYAAELWDALLAAGQAFGIEPCGLGARDTLRLEAGMPLYGHELSETISPAEAGLQPFIKMDKPGFIGKQEFLSPPTRKRIGMVLTDRGIAREGARIYANGNDIGYVTSGTMSPTLGKAIAQALVDASFSDGDAEIEVRGKLLKATTAALPFYKPVKK